MQDLILLLSTVLFFGAGLVVPWVMSLGYVWVDIFSPHLISASLIRTIPVSLLFGVMSFVMYVLADRKSPPKFNAITGLMLCLSVWATLTTFWAVAPVQAWWRWDGAIKAALFATFAPVVFRTRVQIEAFCLVYLFSIAAHSVPWGIKTILTGGGYGQALGIMGRTGFLIEESSVMSGVAVMLTPMCLYWMRYSTLLPKSRLTTIGLWIIMILSLIAAVGTFARTGLIVFGVCGAVMMMRSKRKLLFVTIAAAIVAVLFAVTSDRWSSRIETVVDYRNENSAFVRILVWRWALDFVASHPFGGGFWAYVTNWIEIPVADGGLPAMMFARAWHNIFIAALAEHGYPGLIMYVGLIVLVMLAMRRVYRLTRGLPEFEWCAGLAQMLQLTLLLLCVTGMFTEFGWQPVIWYQFSMAVCLREYVRRVVEPRTTPATAVSAVQTAAGFAGWQPRPPAAALASAPGLPRPPRG